MIEWRECPGHPEYEISEHGSVRRRLPDAMGRLSRRCFKPKTGNSGYLEIGLGPKCARKYYLLHRLVARAFIGEAPSERHEVAHRDGRKENIHFSNLRWSTHSQNEADKKPHGTFNHARYTGEQHPRAKLSEADVLTIRHSHASGVARKELARRYGVAGGYINSIVRRKAWKHLPQIQAA